MKALLKLEDGSRSDRAKRLADLSDFFGKPPSLRPWVARLVGYCEKYRFKREFLDCQIDYSKANNVATRGVYAFFLLEYGKVYEAFNPMARTYNKFPHKRFFCTPNSRGDIRVISEEEAKRTISANGFIRGPKHG